MSPKESVLQFGTGMLLRSIVAAGVDAANHAGHFDGKIAVVQSTPRGVAAAMNRQHGAFTLVERGIESGAPVERSRRIESISHALIAQSEWAAIREIATRPELRIIVSNVTEAGFRLDEHEPPPGVIPPSSYPAKLTDLLHARFTSMEHGPSLFVIPTELVPDNGPALAAMVDTLAARFERADAFRSWIARQVHFCSSLVDRITTVPPHRSPDDDELVTIAELHSLWAIEGDPVELRKAFPIDEASNGAVIFAPDISLYRERKLRLLNGAHTALAPMAMMAGCRTVREAVAHAAVGPFLRRILFDEIAPSTALPPEDAASYAQSVIDRFANPWLDHEWQVILTNQTAKFRVRVIPSIVDFTTKFGRIPDGLTWALAASLRYARTISRDGPAAGEGWWRGRSYRIVDVDSDLIDRHWRAVDPPAFPEPVPEAILAAVAARVLADTGIWGHDLRDMTDAVTKALIGMEGATSLRSG